MKVRAEKHPKDPAVRIVVTAEEGDSPETLDLLYQGILTKEHKEGRYTKSNEFVVFYKTAESQSN